MDLSEPENELATEAATGKPVTPANAGEGIKAMEQRIALLTEQRVKIIALIKEPPRAGAQAAAIRRASLKKLIDGIDTDLTEARARLADYRAQPGQRN